VSEFSIKNQNRETQKRIRLERTQSNGQGFKPGTQERNTAFSIFLLPLPFLSSAALQNSGEFATPQNTIYETNNTSLPQQYRSWMHSTTNQLRDLANDHAKQREHARGRRI
jgi:hypothetical protein